MVKPELDDFSSYPQPISGRQGVSVSLPTWIIRAASSRDKGQMDRTGPETGRSVERDLHAENSNTTGSDDRDAVGCKSLPGRRPGEITVSTC
jgi:hypothetical protein